MPTLPSHQPTTERFIHLAPPRLLQCDYDGTTTEDGFKMTRLDHSAIPALQPDYCHRNFTIFTRLRPAPRVFFSPAVCPEATEDLTLPSSLLAALTRASWAKL
ncbi:uncharacterized protein SEPMUDRAFT_117957 [Sphaerulina musiva SO2202]|uniref:Uncharacterized protein n=1 Tax=Sphaerulina musiva (strain SO2202) TaxID=692275 RepID=N1QJM2_SPHMS|nr:uncharacterized protein SEPMUDRAFT_117957 [Sphaerulina musiva SO2202]EMF12005.1 hypothetical protein SEPMUDRAFT_117957 [Sphaerulina musiva SO2202]